MGGFNYNFGSHESNYGHEAFRNNAWVFLPPILRNRSQAFLDKQSRFRPISRYMQKVNKIRHLQGLKKYCIFIKNLVNLCVKRGG